MHDAIETVTALEACVGKVTGPRDLKVIDHLDEGALRWIAASPLGFTAFGDGEDIGLTLAGGPPGFARPVDALRLRLAATALDEPNLARIGRGVGALFLVPKIGETLRVNGRIAAVSGGEIEIAVEECYMHCAKALLRSNFWATSPQSDVPDNLLDFLTASRFMVLATVDRQGRTDVSPKGDPQGALIHLQHGRVWFADRPGNRRTDSFRNILVQPRIAAAMLIPGCTRVTMVSGMAWLTTDAAVRAKFAVSGKTPPLVTCIEQPTPVIFESHALAQPRLWPAVLPREFLDPAAMFAAHVKLSKAQGLRAALARKALSVPGLMEMGLQRDYRRNLY
ncbi:MAG: pyridoxamine 5'-phosphate oxidase family protein [Nitrospiraceae bacterium]